MNKTQYFALRGELRRKERTIGILAIISMPVGLAFAFLLPLPFSTISLFTGLGAMVFFGIVVNTFAFRTTRKKLRAFGQAALDAFDSNVDV